MKITAMLTHDQVFAALQKAGVVKDASQLNRVVIEAARGQYAVIHLEMIADKKLLEVVRALGPARVTEITAVTGGEEKAPTVLELLGGGDGEREDPDGG